VNSVQMPFQSSGTDVLHSSILYLSLAVLIKACLHVLKRSYLDKHLMFSDFVLIT